MSDALNHCNAVSSNDILEIEIDASETFVFYEALILINSDHLIIE